VVRGLRADDFELLETAGLSRSRRSPSTRCLPTLRPLSRRRCSAAPQHREPARLSVRRRRPRQLLRQCR
jgi:hypothetical protein